MVVRLVNTPSPFAIDEGQELATNEDNKHRAGRQCRSDALLEIEPGFQLNIQEHALAPESFHELLMQTTSVSSGVVAAVAKENLGHGVGLWGGHGSASTTTRCWSEDRRGNPSPTHR